MQTQQPIYFQEILSGSPALAQQSNLQPIIRMIPELATPVPIGGFPESTPMANHPTSQYSNSPEARIARHIQGGALFRVLDAKHKQYLTYKQFKKNLKRVGIRMKKKDRKSVFRKMDTYNMGKITEEQFCAHWTDIHA